jgi:hypothetical protein
LYTKAAGDVWRDADANVLVDKDDPFFSNVKWNGKRYTLPLHDLNRLRAGRYQESSAS